MKRLTTLFCLLLPLLHVSAQSSLFVRNSSWLDFDISVTQVSAYQTNPVHYALHTTHSADWQVDTEVFTTARDSAVVPLGDSVVYEIALSHGQESILMNFKVVGIPGSNTFASRLHGAGYDTGYSSDGNFHTAQVTIAGRALQLHYKADNDDAGQGMDVRIAIHETEIYHIDAADFSNPNVLNVMAYNVQMLPFGVVGLPQAADRADLLPAQFSPYQDVVIFEEAFDPLPRLLNMVPAMEAAGFVHNSGILNDYLPFNGGVIIFSKWPIDHTNQYDFQLCGPNAQDCLANKGIMYARILKLGKPYNVFGTHFDAGSDSMDLAAKNLQYTEMRNFIADQGISEEEPVIWGGDLNTDAANDHNLYSNLRDSIDIIVPDYSGFPESNMSGDTGQVIDHIFCDPRYLIPVEAKVFITTFRSLESVLWDLSDFSDHRSAIGRFRFPDVGATVGDQNLCPGDPLVLQSHADIPVQRTWYHDGQPIPNLNGAVYSVLSTTAADAGHYELEIQYSQTYGNLPGAVNQLMHPGGPEAYTEVLRWQMADVTVLPSNCATTSESGWELGVSLFPNPSNGIVQLRKVDGEALTWQLCDLRGQALLQGVWTGTQTQLSLADVSAGSYVIQLQDRKGKRVVYRLQLVP